MTELEADDALAAAAQRADASPVVQKVCIWTPDKDLAQCVRTDRVVQIDRRRKTIRDAEGVRSKFGVEPTLIPDYLALVGDAADGFPGIEGIGPVGAARLLNQYGPLEAFPENALKAKMRLALLFKELATLRTDFEPVADVAELRWRGQTNGFSAWAEQAQAPALLRRCDKAAQSHA